MSFPAVAKFPSTLWDGSSASRSVAIDGEPILEVYRPPGPDDWSQLTAEVLNMQIQAGAGGVAALSATKGHAYIPNVAGTPTGVPQVKTGFTAVVYDTTAHKLWIYDAGWKTSGAVS